MKFTSAISSLCLAAVISACSAFVQHPQQNVVPAVNSNMVLMAKFSGDTSPKKQNQQSSFGMGTFVEFQEKKRMHAGKIIRVEYKSNGGARYSVEDSEGKKYGIADKQVAYAIACPNSPGQASELYADFCRAQNAPIDSLNNQLEMSAELLEMAWEEKSSEDNAEGDITAEGLIELVQGHAASTMEKYMAWKLLSSNVGHLFFKEIKEHGRVVAFKAKTIKTVEVAKKAFCESNEDSELCFV